MNVYIQSAAQISIQQPLCEEWMEKPVFHHQRHALAIEPDYKGIIDPKTARRMGRCLKRALTTSIKATENRDRSKIDAIITGTGLGCIENTEKFLLPLVTEGENLLPPTYFMQSTHNTISSQVAIHLNCHGYNCTYSHRGTSFESALIDAYGQMQAGEIQTALVGGHDEMTERYFQLFDAIGYWKKEEIDEEQLLKSQTPGSYAGETSLSMLISTEKTDNYLCVLKGIDLLYQPTTERLAQSIDQILAANQLTRADIGWVLCGFNGDCDYDQVYRHNMGQLLPDSQLLAYKHIFGESFTSGATGIYVAAQCLAKGFIPAHLTLEGVAVDREPQHILVYNHFQNKDHSIALLSKR